MSGWLIVNARLVNEGRISECDVRIRSGRIESIAPSLKSQARETPFDARGRLLLPGMIDGEVHFREPGLAARGTIATESRAAVAGGVTSFVDWPDSQPATVSAGNLADKLSRAGGRSTANFGFVVGATDDNLEMIKNLPPDYPAAVHGRLKGDGFDYGVSQPEQLLLVVQQASSPVIITSEHHHLEQLIAGIDSPERSVRISGLSRASEIEALHNVSDSHHRLSASADLAHLFFIDADRETLGHRLDTRPELGSEDDRKALRQAVKSGQIDTLVSAHAPCLLKEKLMHADLNPGLPGIQQALPAAWTVVAARLIDPPTLVDRIAHQPARWFGIRERGFVREGYHADLVLLDPDSRTDVNAQPTLSQCGWTPFSGRKLPARVSATWVNGRLVYRDGLLTGMVPGQPLQFNRK